MNDTEKNECNHLLGWTELDYSGTHFIEQDSDAEEKQDLYGCGDYGKVFNFCPDCGAKLIKDEKTGLTFGVAIDALKQGKKIRRNGWKDGIWIALTSFHHDLINSGKWNENNLKWVEHENRMYESIPLITVNETPSHITRWVMAHADVLAEDWEVLE